MDPVIVLLIFIFLIIFIMTSGFHVVPQNQAFIIERLGSYNKTIETGLYWTMPLIDRIARKIDLTEQNITIMHDEREALVSYQVTDPKLYHYGMLESNMTLSRFIENAMDERTIHDHYFMNQSLKEYGIMIHELKIK